MPKDPNRRLNYLLIYGVLFISPLLLRNPANQIFYNHILQLTQNHFVILLLLIVILISLLEIKQFSYNYLWKICIFLVCFNILLKKDLPRIKTVSHFYVPQKFLERQWLHYDIVEPLFKQIALETNWDAKTAMKRIFSIIGVNPQISLFSYYSLAKKNLGKKKKNNLSEFTIETDGYFIIQHIQQFINYSEKDWKQYLSHSPFVSNFIQKEIRENKVIIKPPKLYGRLWLIPYKITEKSIFPEGFHNIGQPYYWEEPNWLTNCAYTRHFINDNEFYYCMILPGHLQRAGVHIKFAKDIQPFIDIVFFGPLLGLKEKTSNVDGYALWSDMRISLFCNNKKYLYNMPDIGYNSESPQGLQMIQFKSLNTPLKLKIPIHCEKNKISQIKLKFEHFRQKTINYSEITPHKQEIIWKNF